MQDGQVTFRYRDSATRHWKTRTLPAEEFIRRFLQHVLPKPVLSLPKEVFKKSATMACSVPANGPVWPWPETYSP